MVGVREEPRVHLHHPRCQPPRLRRQRVPVRDVRVVPGQLRIGRHHAQFLLPGQHPLPVGVPPVVELPGVPVGPLLRHMMRGVHRAGAEMQVERLVRGDLLGVGDELDRLVGQVLGQVIALLRGARRLDLVVVVDQVRVPLAGVPAEEPVEPLEPAAQRPAVERPGAGLELRGQQVVLADHVGAVAMGQQHLGQEPVLERDLPVVPGIAGGELVDRRGRVRVVIAAGDDARPRRRAQRRGVHVRVQQPAGGQRVQVRRGDRAAVTAQLPVPDVIQHDEQHVRRPCRRPQRPRPRRAGLIGRPADHTRKGAARLILLNRHVVSSPSVKCLSGHLQAKSAACFAHRHPPSRVILCNPPKCQANCGSAPGQGSNASRRK